LKYAILAILGVGKTQVTHNGVPCSNVRTVKYTIGAVGVTGCDKNFVTANDAAEQVITLAGALPAFARLLDIKTRTKVAFAHLSTAIASWAVDTNVVTIVTAIAHGLVTGNSVVIAGMTEDALDGTHSITRVDDTSFTFALTHDDGGDDDDTGTVTFAALAIAAETGTSSSGNQLIASATVKAVNAITATAHAFNLNIAPAAAAADVFVSVTPDGKWNHVTTGQLEVYITYIAI
jgi:hypothetical protein